MASLKEQLQQRSSANTKSLKLVSAPDLEVTIRRLTVRERNQIIGKYNSAKDAPDRDSTMSVAIVAKALVPEMTEEEVQDLDAAVADEIADEVMQFHGWTKKGRAELTDQFRPTA